MYYTKTTFIIIILLSVALLTCTSFIRVKTQNIVLAEIESTQVSSKLTRCDSGVNEMPNHLETKFQSQKIFLGYTYTLQKKDKAEDDCDKASGIRSNLEKVDEEIKSTLRTYISSIKDNEKTVNSLEKIVSYDKGLLNVSYASLCIKINCENNRYKFAYKNLEDIKWAKSYTDSHLFVDVIGKLREINKSKYNNKYEESEFVRLIEAARQIAIKNIKQ